MIKRFLLGYKNLALCGLIIGAGAAAAIGCHALLKYPPGVPLTANYTAVAGCLIFTAVCTLTDGLYLDFLSKAVQADISAGADREDIISRYKIAEPFAKEMDVFFITKNSHKVSTVLHILSCLALINLTVVFSVETYGRQRTAVPSILLSCAPLAAVFLTHLHLWLRDGINARYRPDGGRNDGKSLYVFGYCFLYSIIGAAAVGAVGLCTDLTPTVQWTLTTAVLLSCVSSFLGVYFLFYQKKFRDGRDKKE
ncbi:MAG: hypothetical protein LBP26_02110 [Clostridiales bacterium]|jgi:hypothetical protein|nr:hypothetical protein [Clostridiales bacterium]